MILLRYTNGAWQQLSTSYIMSDGVYSYYSATTLGFSVFAVAWVANPAQAPTISPQEPTNYVLDIIIIGSIGAIILFMMILIAPVVKKNQGIKSKSKLIRWSSVVSSRIPRIDVRCLK